jgi:hypothetical protein
LEGFRIFAVALFLPVRLSYNLFSFNPYFISLFVSAFLLGAFASARGQSPGGLSDIKVSFLKDTVEQSGNGLSFNRVSIINQSSRKKVINVDLDLPESWSSPFGSSKIFELGPNAVLELPVRTAASPGTLSTRVYPVTVKVQSPGSPIILAT